MIAARSGPRCDKTTAVHPEALHSAGAHIWSAGDPEEAAQAEHRASSVPRWSMNRSAADVNGRPAMSAGRPWLCDGRRQNSEYRSLFGEPLPAFWTTPVVVLALTASLTWAGSAVGWPAR